MNKYQTHFKKPYETLDETIKKEINRGNHVLDLGSNSGTIASMIDKYHKGCLIHCVDIDEDALRKIGEEPLESTRTISYHSDVNEFLDSSELSSLDAITINATLHEINNPSAQREFMRNFFRLCNQRLKPNGRIIVGDYYYPDNVSDADVAEYMQQQLKEINHADSREKFVQPSLIWEVALESGLYVARQIEIPAVRGIDRRYYTIIIRGEENGN